MIWCTNADEGTSFRSEEAGTIKIKIANGGTMELDHVIYARTLSENLLSLRKFAESGLIIYLDNERIDIFDPVSNEIFLTGIYNNSF